MIRSRASLASGLLVLALAVPTGATTPPVEAPRPVRVRMELFVDVANDSWGSPFSNNDADEVYYFLVRPQQGDALKIREVRPAGTPDFWEMGEETEKTLHRWLVAGKASTAAPLRFALVVAEQDPASAGGDPPGIETTPYDADLKQGIAEAAARVRARSHDLMGEVQITATADRLTVTTRTGLNVKTTGTSAKIEFWDHHGKYDVHLFLEPDTGAPPTGRRFLGLEDDDCQPGKSLVVTGTAGDVVVPPGGTKTVTIAKKRFTWHCGGSEESSVARPKTQEIDVVRVHESDKIRWKCFKRIPLAPDITW